MRRTALAVIALLAIALVPAGTSAAPRSGGGSLGSDIRELDPDAKHALTLSPQEKKTIRSVKYEGLNSITNSEVLEKLREKKATISQESTYDPSKIKKAENVIKMMLAEKGHQDATIEASTEEIPPNSVAVT